jgi:NAD(P)-dependent dehydrogenase (short-subunit alcohol dehydrogenase family)
VKDICRAAGLSDRYFYESFASGAELFIAAFDRANEHLFGVVSIAVAEAGGDPETQGRAGLEAFVRELAGDPRLARIVFVEAPSAGAEGEQHRRATLRRFAVFAVANARPLLPRRVEPADISDAVLFLASDEARYITGATLPVDAGTLVK